MDRVINKVLTFFSLFGSMSTLLCCALPVTLVSLGLGASFASLTSTFPQITWLASHKDALFIITGITLILSFYLMKQAERRACPINTSQRELCTSSKTISKKVFWITIIIYSIGVFFSFVLPYIY